MDISRVALAVLVASVATAACSSSDAAGGAEPDVHDDDGENVESTSSALVASDPISRAVTGTECSTTVVKGLGTQLVEEIQCLQPGSMKRIEGTPGIALSASTFPFLQTPAANALLAAQKARGQTLSVNSGLRTLPQQYLLYRWYQTGRCNIPLAARPGTSNHESAVAVDIKDDAAWRNAMQSNGFRWLGANDRVHFDYVGGGAVDMRGLSVRAFQRLWNRNNPTDKIAEDGSYGEATELRLAKSPVGGFPIGARCDKPSPGPSSPPSQEPPVTPAPSGADVPAVPDATEPGPEEARSPGGGGLRPLNVEDSGCSASPASGSREGFGGVLVLLGVALGLRRRRAGF